MPGSHKNKEMILIAEDDPDDCMLFQLAYETSTLKNPLCFVEDGQAMIDYLDLHTSHASLPGLILLDLNMPKKDGFEALQEIKASPAFRRIPVVILTTTKDERTIAKAYDLGSSGYIVKPSSLEKFREAIETLGKYWFRTVILPPAGC